MADYLLWGKDASGKNGKQQGLDLRGKRGTWDESPIDSLEQIMEQPTFNENSLSALGTTHFRTKKEVFSREEALASASPLVKQSFLVLFSEIDRLDFLIAQWDLNHGKRTKPIRAELVNRFSQEEIAAMQEKVTHWNQYHYLKKRHELVELRREQYTLRDSYRKIMLTQNSEGYYDDTPIDFDVDITVLPLGVKHDNYTASLVFRTWRELDPEHYSEEDLSLISQLYWSKQKSASAPTTSPNYIDFRDPEHVYNISNILEDLTDASERASIDSNLIYLLDTFKFYCAMAKLSEVQQEILDLKLDKVKNIDIAEQVNKKYGKSYTQNYISTIYRQKIIPKICEAAAYHESVIANIFFPENFKHCSACGEIMLKCPENFTRRSRSSDGFSSRCKACEKKARQNAAEEK